MSSDSQLLKDAHQRAKERQIICKYDGIYEVYKTRLLKALEDYDGSDDNVKIVINDIDLGELQLADFVDDFNRVLNLVFNDYGYEYDKLVIYL
jgi:hypothetical protein